MEKLSIQDIYEQEILLRDIMDDEDRDMCLLRLALTFGEGDNQVRAVGRYIVNGVILPPAEFRN